MNESQNLQEYRERRPDPDPTRLTSDALNAVTVALKDQINREFNSAEKLLNARMSGTDRVLGFMQGQIDRISPELSLKIQALKDIVDEKFQGTAAQFSERDTRFLQESKDQRAMVDATAQSMKDMVRQTDEVNRRQFEQITASITDLRSVLAERTETMAQRAERAIDTLRAEFLTKLAEDRRPAKGIVSGQLWLTVAIVGSIMIVGGIIVMLIRMPGAVL